MGINANCTNENLDTSFNTTGYDKDSPDDEEEQEDDNRVKLPSMKEINKQRDEERARRGSHFYGLIKKDITHKTSFDDTQPTAKTTPNRPRYVEYITPL